MNSKVAESISKSSNRNSNKFESSIKDNFTNELSTVDISTGITPEIRKLLYRHQTKYYNNNKSKIMDRNKKTKQRNREEKKFFCEPCQKAFSDKTILTNHLKIKKHNPTRYVKYVCEFDWCSYETTIKTRFTRHMDSLKHKHYK